MRHALARFRDLYSRLYALVCGRPPARLRPVHYLWLAAVDLVRDLQEVLPRLHGRVLDVGCGEQPYRGWLRPDCEYVGVDVEKRPGNAAVIRPGERWPLEDNSFGAVLCTQVLEHDSDPDHTLAEIERVLEPGGTAVITVPFAYNEHARPYDFRRWSAAGAAGFVGQRLEVTEVRKQGRGGSLIGTLWLNWIEHQVGLSPGLQIVRALLMPVWILFSGLVNATARGMDRLDRTGAFYLNVLVVAAKRAD
jgi:SAM-dependent methyltransferase